jgi:hypothetical protein
VYFCIENAPTLISIDFCSVATRPTLVAIGSHRVATRSGQVAIVLNPVRSCNGSKLLQLVPSSWNWYNIIVAIGLFLRLQLVYTQI